MPKKHIHLTCWVNVKKLDPVLRIGNNGYFLLICETKSCTMPFVHKIVILKVQLI
jgi:hypothetical protein